MPNIKEGVNFGGLKVRKINWSLLEVRVLRRTTTTWEERVISFTVLIKSHPLPGKLQNIPELPRDHKQAKC